MRTHLAQIPALTPSTFTAQPSLKPEPTTLTSRGKPQSRPRPVLLLRPRGRRAPPTAGAVGRRPGGVRNGPEAPTDLQPTPAAAQRAEQKPESDITQGTPSANQNPRRLGANPEPRRQKGGEVLGRAASAVPGRGAENLVPGGAVGSGTPGPRGGRRRCRGSRQVSRGRGAGPGKLGALGGGPTARHFPTGGAVKWLSGKQPCAELWSEGRF